MIVELTAVGFVPLAGGVLLLLTALFFASPARTPHPGIIGHAAQQAHDSGPGH